MTTTGAAITETGNTVKAIRILHDLAQWGLKHTGSETIGELVRQMVNHDQDNPAWEELATTKLSRLAGPEAKAAAALREWAEGLEPDEQQVFSNLTGDTAAKSAGEPERPGAEAQNRFWKKLSDFIRSPEGDPASRRVREIREVIGPAMAQEEADTALDLSPEIEPLRELLLTLAGPYERDSGWLVLAGARRDDPTKEILETAHNGTVSAELASYRLRAWGLPMERHVPWLTKDGRVRAEDGKAPAVGSRRPGPGRLRPGRTGPPLHRAGNPGLPGREGEPGQRERPPGQGRQVRQGGAENLGPDLLEPAGLPGRRPQHAGGAGGQGGPGVHGHQRAHRHRERHLRSRRILPPGVRRRINVRLRRGNHPAQDEERPAE